MRVPSREFTRAPTPLREARSAVRGASGADISNAVASELAIALDAARQARGARETALEILFSGGHLLAAAVHLAQSNFVTASRRPGVVPPRRPGVEVEVGRSGVWGATFRLVHGPV